MKELFDERNNKTSNILQLSPPGWHYHLSYLLHIDKDRLFSCITIIQKIMCNTYNIPGFPEMLLLLVEKLTNKIDMNCIPLGAFQDGANWSFHPFHIFVSVLCPQCTPFRHTQFILVMEHQTKIG